MGRALAIWVDRPMPRVQYSRRPRCAMTNLFFRRLTFVALSLSLLGAAGCRGGPRAPGDKVSAPSRPIEDVLAEHAPKLMALQGVTAVGQSALRDGAPCIRVFLLKNDPGLERRIPRRIEGYPVVIQVTGPIRAMPEGTP
jgi:hypothetical protein